MLDFNNVIEDINSKNITDKILLSMLDIRVVFFNKYKYLIEVENPSENTEFQKITNIIDNIYSIKDNTHTFIMEKQFHLLLEKYFKVIDTNQIYVGYKEHEYSFIEKTTEEYFIYTDGIFIIKCINTCSFDAFPPVSNYSIKLVSNNNDIIEKISDLTCSSHYNNTVRDITEGCLDPLKYYNKFLKFYIEYSVNTPEIFIENYNSFGGTLQFYVDKNNPNKFHFIYDTIYMGMCINKPYYTQNKKLSDNDKFINLFKFGNEELYDFMEACLLNKEKQTTITPIYNSIANINVIGNKPECVKLTIDSDLSEIPEYVCNLCTRMRLNDKNEYKEKIYSNKTLNVLTVEFL